MDFLTAALYCLDKSEGSKEELSGALLTRFDPNDFTARAQVYYATVADLASLRDGEIEATGFRLDESGVLFADTGCRKTMESELADYVGREYSRPREPAPGLIDLVLKGAATNCQVLVNQEQVLEGATPITIPFANFKVSESSFNIYGYYRNVEDKFRTYSLVDIVDEKPITLTIVVPDDAKQGLGSVMSLLTLASDISVVEDAKVYTAVLPLNPVTVSAGEAFCNYLAFNVAYYKLGLDIIEQFLREGKYTSVPRDEDEQRVRKVPKRNLSILSTMKRPCVDKVLDRLSYPEDLQKLIDVNDEAAVTYAWLTNIMVGKQGVEGETDQEKLLASCTNLRVMCKRNLLHYSCELLAQRYYLCGLGPLDNTIGLTLRGGGVRGCAIKRTSW